MFDFANALPENDRAENGISENAKAYMAYTREHPNDGVFDWEIDLPQSFMTRLNLKMMAKASHYIEKWGQEKLNEALDQATYEAVKELYKEEIMIKKFRELRAA